MMRLKRELETTEKFAPGLCKRLQEIGLTQLESGDEKLADILRTFDLPGLVIPRAFGGRGASLVEAVQVQRALGSHSPSLAVMATMHGFSCSFLSVFGVFDAAGAQVLREICAQKLLVASGFAEGRPGAELFDYQTVATRAKGGYLLNGRKRPCTLAHEMDILTLGFVFREGSEPQTGLAMIPAESPGISRRPFWKSSVLRAAGSEEVVLEDVFVPDAMIFLSDPSDAESLAQMRSLEFLGISSFQLFVAASYLGVATALVERLTQVGRAQPSDLAELWTDLEGAMISLEGAAHRLEGRQLVTLDDMVSAMITRFASQKAVYRSVDLALELLGGNAFFADPAVGYLASAARCLVFHPIGRRQADAIIAGSLMASEQTATPALAAAE